MKKWFYSLVFFFILSSQAFSQLTASFFQNETFAKIGIGYEFNEKIWADMRIYSGTNVDNFTPEIVVNYNFLRKENYDAYLGLGVTLNNINGVVLPLGVAIKPFENLKNLSLNIEFSPLYEIDFDDLFIRGFVGIRYVLK